jgi:hypothetical protein
LFDSVEQPTAEALRKQLDIVHKFYEKPSWWGLFNCFAYNVL